MMPHNHPKTTLAGLSPEILEEIAKHSNDLSTAGIMNHALALRYTHAGPQAGVIRPFACALSMVNQQLVEGNRYQSDILPWNDTRPSDALLFTVLERGYDKFLLKSIIRRFPQVLVLQNEFGNTPLHIALINDCDWEIIELMFPKDPNTNHDLLLTKNKFHFTPLHVGIRNVKCSNGNTREMILGNLVDYHGVVLANVCNNVLFTPLQTLINTCDISSSKLVTMMYKMTGDVDQRASDSILLKQDCDGETALHLALNMGVVNEGDLTIREVVLLLIDSQEKVLLAKSRKDIYKLDPNASTQSFENNTPLHTALVMNRGHTVCDDTVLSLIDKKQEVLLLRNSVDSRNKKLYATPLHIAIRYGASMTVIKALVDTAGLALAIGDYNADTPLHYALRTTAHNHDVLEFLISQIIEKGHQSVFRQMGNYGDTCLHAAVRAGADAEIMKWLIDADAGGLSMKNHRQTVQGAAPYGENTPLHICLLTDGNRKIQTMLLDADRNALWMQNATESTPLHIALREMICTLRNITPFAPGPDESTQRGVPTPCGMVDSDGNTPLHVSLLQHKPRGKKVTPFEEVVKVIQMLISHNRQALHTQNRNLRTPLHHLTFWETNANIHCLVQLLTPPDSEEDVRLVVDDDGQTPLHHALSNGCPIEIVRYLRDKNKKVCLIQNDAGKTPLHVLLTGMNHPTEFSDLTRDLLDDECSVLWKKDGAGDLPLHVALKKGRDFPTHIIGCMIPRRREPPALVALTPVGADVSRETLIAQETAQANSVAHVRSVAGRKNETILHVAIHLAHRAHIIDMLCQRFAAPKYNFTTTRNDIGETPLHAGVRQNLSLDAMCVIVHASGEEALFVRNVSTKIGKSGHLPPNTEMDTPLHSAIQFRRNNALLQLLMDKNGMILQVKNHNGDTPLHHACIGDVDMVMLHGLLSANPRDTQSTQDALRAGNQRGQTPLLFALTLLATAIGGDYDHAGKVFYFMKNFMIDKDERVLQDQDSNGKTPLHIAVTMLNAWGGLRVMGIAWLIDKQQNVLCLPDNDGLTPLHAALTRRSGTYINMIDSELNALIDIHQRVLCTKNTNGDTPLQHALRIRATDVRLFEHLVGASEDVL